MLESWAQAELGENEKLDYPLPNIYVPKQVPQPCKAERKEDDPIGTPI